MALQAQYPSNFVLRREQERKEMESAPQVATGFLGQSAVLVTDGANGNAQKRSREAAGIPLAPPPQQQNHPVSLISLQAQPCSPALVNLAPQHQIHQPSLLTTCLGLASEDKQHHRSPKQFNLFSSSPASSSSCSSLFSSELAAQINHQNNEIEQFLLAKGEQLRRELAERRQRHYRALLNAAEESAARRLREKEAEVGRLARRRGELENRLALLRTETMAWQAKAMADQVTAAALNAQLEKAAAAPERKEISGDSPLAEDAESGFEDPDRVERERACRSCQYRRASVVLLPCRHLCLCDACDAASDSCPVCRCVTTGSVRVLLS